MLSTQDAIARTDTYRDHMLLKNFSRATVKTYLFNYTRYMDWCIANDIQHLFDQELVKAYLVHRVNSGAKWQTMNNIYSAMRKLFREVLFLD